MSGWSAILEKAQKIRELRERTGTPEEAAVAAQKLQDLLIVTKLLTVFETFDSEAEALKSYS